MTHHPAVDHGFSPPRPHCRLMILVFFFCLIGFATVTSSDDSAVSPGLSARPLPPRPATDASSQPDKVLISKGDVNLDTVVDGTDVLLLAAHLAGLVPSVPMIAADADVDGQLTAVDLVWLINRCHDFMSAGSVWATDSIVGELMYVPAGTFLQGSPENEPCRVDIETQFTHTLSHSLAVMSTEITRQMWADLLAAQPSLPADPTDTAYGAGMDNPAQRVTWYEAVLFANLLSLEQGLTPCYYTEASFTTPVDAANYLADDLYCRFDVDGYRLPTEGEWEYCCRAGTDTPFWIDEPNFTADNCYSTYTAGMYPYLETVAWFWGNSSTFVTTSPVAGKEPNPWGLYDVHGNVWEWCWDWSSDYPVGSVSDYRGPASGSDRAVRSGGWRNYATYSRSASRDYNSPGYRYYGLGFRLLRSLD